MLHNNYNKQSFIDANQFDFSIKCQSELIQFPIANNDRALTDVCHWLRFIQPLQQLVQFRNKRIEYLQL
jgi:hypothetical protein